MFYQRKTVSRVSKPSWRPSDRTPERRFEFLSIDHIGRCITSNNVALSRLGVLLERAKDEDARKIDAITSNIKENNVDLHELRDEFGRRRENVVSPPLRPRTTVELDRKTNSDDLITLSWVPVLGCQRQLRSATGYMRNLKARAKEEKRSDEVSILDNEMRRISLIDKDLRGKIEKIKKLEIDG